ncbi:hypothetical protein A1O3_06393 [Capronia epimyces CBS 606.96]|uniref:Transcription factor domain-containing protein n=1 Tax=Capronia epimyces CBS 606.96 TaxID=1182542 RepID=W9XYX7_9EURO|nr:uncharacterized protein A1O3_06393 [Capronia epimyces CBS 606.96]EXJ82580.1 hypothetical protein A1O3_06393 [Capronia epimyces CBS 606.96]
MSLGRYPQVQRPHHLQGLRTFYARGYGLLTLKDSLSAYCREIEPWFHVISIPRLQSQLPQTWEEVSVDVVLLCLSIALLTTPPPSPSSPVAENGDGNGNGPWGFQTLYCQVKNWISSTEALGLNSCQLVQARILVTLYEVAHGLYPAAYISIGATVNAADALTVHPGAGAAAQYPHAPGTDDETKREDGVLIWGGILILDRYIAVDSGPHPSLTRSRSQAIHDLLKPTLCPTHWHGQDPTDPICRLARLVEASFLLDKTHSILNSPTAEHTINIEELILTVQTIINLQTILGEEVKDGVHLYAGGLSLCNAALLLAFENGTRVPPIAGSTENCNSMATESLASVLSTITSTVELFTLGTQSVEFNVLRVPPFVTFLVYKAAAIVTKRLLVDTSSSGSDEELGKLRLLRNFLKIMGARWLGCGK